MIGGALRFPSSVYGYCKSAYPTFAVPEMDASDTCFSFSIVICRIKLFGVENILYICSVFKKEHRAKYTKKACD